MKGYIAQFPNARGTVAIIVAIGLIAFLGFAALAVDVGYMMMAKNELQDAADAAALAGTRYLGHIYENLTYTEQDAYDLSTHDTDKANIIDATTAVALKNKAAGVTITVPDADIEFGVWDSSQPDGSRFTATNAKPTAVKVITRRDSSNSPISTFAARVLGINTVSIRTVATASLTSQLTMPESGLPCPLGISQLRASRSFCGTTIVLNPTKDSCAAWHTYESSQHSANVLNGIIQDLMPPAYRLDKKFLNDPTFVSPETTAFETLFNFTGGDLAGNFEAFRALFDYMKTRDGDDDPNAWSTAVPIYAESGDMCKNMSNMTTIVGFSTVKIYFVGDPANKVINADIECGYVEPGRGGGGSVGNLGAIPNLVQ